MTDNSKRISMEDMQLYETCFVQSPIVQMCRQMIHHQLLNNGIKFCQGSCKDKKGMKMNAEEEDLIEDKWVPFCGKIIDSVLCHGFVVVHIGKCYPTVLRLSQYWLKIRIDSNNELEFLVYEKGEADKLMKNVIVFNHFGFEPNTNGLLNSPMKRILPRLQFLKQIRQSAIMMEARRSVPSYFSEQKDTGQSHNNKEGVDYDFYADANAAETNEELKYSRNATEMSLFNKQKDLYEQYMNPYASAQSAAQLDNVTSLPMGHHIINTPTTTGRGDLVNIHKVVQDEICATFGVPRSMMISDSGKQSIDNVGTHQSFMHTLLWWKKKLSVCLSDVYNTINAEKISEKIDFKKNTCVDELKKKYKVNVYFPVTPFVSNDDLRKLYEQGIISWKAYGEYALRNISLPIDDLQPKAPEVDELLFKKPEVKEPAAGASGKRKAEDGVAVEPDKKKAKGSEDEKKKEKKDDKKDKKDDKKDKKAKE